MSERQRAADALELRLGHSFSDKALLEEALTHASVGQGARKVRHNERLEFLGDRVLGLTIAEALVRRLPAATEGELAKRLNALVSGRTCAEIARGLGVGPALRLPGGETKRGAREHDTFLADACEALLAAIYLDGGLEAARGVVEREWAERLNADPAEVEVSPKTTLQEWALARAKPLPAYEVVGREGPEHAPTFRVEVRVEGCEPALGVGGSRQAAEKTAAAALLAREGAPSPFPLEGGSAGDGGGTASRLADPSGRPQPGFCAGSSPLVLQPEPPPPPSPTLPPSRGKGA